MKRLVGWLVGWLVIQTSPFRITATWRTHSRLVKTINQSVNRSEEDDESCRVDDQ